MKKAIKILRYIGMAFLAMSIVQGGIVMSDRNTTVAETITTILIIICLCIILGWIEEIESDVQRQSK